MNNILKANNYKNQNGCQNCKHRFEYYDYDCELIYYCTLGAKPRPLCGSISRKESFDKNAPDAKTWQKRWGAWEKWISGKQVFGFGICDRYEKGEEEELNNVNADVQKTKEEKIRLKS